MAQTKSSMAINRPEYDGMRNRLRNYIKGNQGSQNVILEFDGKRTSVRENPLIEGNLTPDLHYLSVIKRSDLL